MAGYYLGMHLRRSWLKRHAPDQINRFEERFTKQHLVVAAMLPLALGVARWAGDDVSFVRYLIVTASILGFCFVCFLPIPWLFKLRYGISANEEETKRHLGMALYLVALVGLAMGAFTWGLLTADRMGWIDISL